ncbi:unnamed protein product [Acanthosepion pharaonis]|uniref:Uncharacterized protein n=1 Tax=Acanthosepion pharaonis TaxID=158019 RepID=A0A812E5C7_ACAPH|nr:unnamed protein product [Sepia pharaonis]
MVDSIDTTPASTVLIITSGTSNQPSSLADHDPPSSRPSSPAPRPRLQPSSSSSSPADPRLTSLRLRPHHHQQDPATNQPSPSSTSSPADPRLTSLHLRPHHHQRTTNQPPPSSSSSLADSRLTSLHLRPHHHQRTTNQPPPSSSSSLADPRLASLRLRPHHDLPATLLSSIQPDHQTRSLPDSGTTFTSSPTPFRICIHCRAEIKFGI